MGLMQEPLDAQSGHDGHRRIDRRNTQQCRQRMRGPQQINQGGRHQHQRESPEEDAQQEQGDRRDEPVALLVQFDHQQFQSVAGDRQHRGSQLA